MTAARTRIRQWKPKGTNLWVVCIHESEGNSRRAFALTTVRSVIESAGENIAGFAVVCWTRDLVSYADAHNLSSPIPIDLIPEYVKSRLLAQGIRDWVAEG